MNENIGFDPSNLIDNEEDIINIDTTLIDTDSLKEAEGLLDNLKDLYTDPKFMENNPKFATRLAAELENLRIMLKMRKSDEITHDILLNSISKNPGNASLYRSLTDIQKTILQTTKDISDKMKDINTMMRNVQLEINFQQEETVDEETGEVKETDVSSQGTFRGSKDFIKQMKSEMDEEK